MGVGLLGPLSLTARFIYEKFHVSVTHAAGRGLVDRVSGSGFGIADVGRVVHRGWRNGITGKSVPRYVL